MAERILESRPFSLTHAFLQKLWSSLTDSPDASDWNMLILPVTVDFHCSASRNTAYINSSVSFSKEVYLEECLAVCESVCVCRLWTRWCFCFLRPLLIRVIMRFTGPTHTACLLEVRRRDIYLEKWQHYKQTRAPYLPFNLYKPQHSLTQRLSDMISVFQTKRTCICVRVCVLGSSMCVYVCFIGWLTCFFLKGGHVDFRHLI